MTLTDTSNSPKQPRIRPFSGSLLILIGIAAIWGQRQLLTPGLPLAAGLIAGYAGLVVLITSLVDWLDGQHSSNAYADFGRFFVGIGGVAAAFGIALATTGTREAADLLRAAQAIPVLAIFTALLAFLAYFAQRTAGKQPGNTAAPTPGKMSLSGVNKTKSLLALTLLVTAAYLLNQRLNEHQQSNAEYDQQNEIERIKAPPWTYKLDEFAAGVSPETLRTRLNKDGYRVYCPRNLTSKEKIATDNKVNCWAMLKSAYGIPAIIASFWFNDQGLTNYLIRFEKDQWSAVTLYLDANSKRMTDDLGSSSPGGPPVRGWLLENGVLMSAEADTDQFITMLWTARDKYVEDECTARRKALIERNRRVKQNIETWWPGTDCASLPLPPKPG